MADIVGCNGLLSAAEPDQTRGTLPLVHRFDGRNDSIIAPQCHDGGPSSTGGRYLRASSSSVQRFLGKGYRPGPDNHIVISRKLFGGRSEVFYTRFAILPVRDSVLACPPGQERR